MTGTDVAVSEVLEPGQRSLRELADEANREHALVLEAGASMLEHAIRAGAALNAAKERVADGEWVQWLADNFADRSPASANSYMRLSRYEHEVRASGVGGVRAAAQYLVAIGAPHNRLGRPRHPTWMREEAVRLREEGATLRKVASELGVSHQMVLAWTDPERVRRHAAMSRARTRERRAAESAAARALKEQERQQAIKRAVRKAGAAEQELYAMGERMQDVMGQAHREATDPEKRRHYALAGEHYRKMRDEIVRALGVS